MVAKYDDATVELTPGFIAALENLMREQMKMLGARNGGKYADCWTWGRCEISDLSVSSGVSFTFGGDDPGDKPDGMTEDVQVICLPV